MKVTAASNVIMKTLICYAKSTYANQERAIDEQKSLMRHNTLPAVIRSLRNELLDCRILWANYSNKENFVEGLFINYVVG